ncbi:hypothetical protein GL213_03455 [Halogeometricum borinquense]|nr:hypothetical protein [Halogeometricum borinquense]QIQ75666.1 hypothetical protein GL213_03455 [Halogeometricum borinquense]
MENRKTKFSRRQVLAGTSGIAAVGLLGSVEAKAAETKISKSQAPLVEVSVESVGVTAKEQVVSQSIAWPSHHITFPKSKNKAHVYTTESNLAADLSPQSTIVSTPDGIKTTKSDEVSLSRTYVDGSAAGSGASISRSPPVPISVVGGGKKTVSIGNRSVELTPHSTEQLEVTHKVPSGEATVNYEISYHGNCKVYSSSEGILIPITEESTRLINKVQKSTSQVEGSARFDKMSVEIHKNRNAYLVRVE